MINIDINKHEENGEIYYLATSEDIQGLIAQGSTLDETLELAKELVCDLLLIRSEIDSTKSVNNITNKI
jgi:predicted RNase H-like HicB family nuclease